MSTVDLRGRFWTSPTVTFLAVSMQSYTRLIHDLFSNNEQGFVYDPNDLSTLFQDVAGTTPVTAAGQPVGLVLDKSKGMALGVEMASSLTSMAGWSVAGSSTSGTVTSDGASINFNANGTEILALLRSGLSAAKWYKATITVASVSGLFVVETAPGGAGFPITAPGTYSYFIRGRTNIYFRNNPNTIATAKITAISVKEVAGNHAYSTVSASRPLLGRQPEGGARNLLAYSGDFANSVWNKSAITVNSTSETPPLTSMSVIKLLDTTANSPHFVNNTTLSLLPNIRGTFSIFAKAAEITKLRLEVQDFGKPDIIRCDFDLVAGTVINQENLGLGTQATATIVPMGNGWYRCVISGIPSTSATGRYVPSFHLMKDFVTNIFTGTGTQGLYIAGAQLEVGAVATNYQETTTLLDITERGKVSRYYLKFDGVDDSLQTNNIDFTGTDKVSLFAGVRKLSDANAAILCELGSDINSNNGSFYLAAPLNATTKGFALNAKGTTAGAAVTTLNNIAPASAVLTGYADLRSTQLKLRLTGIVNTAEVSLGFGNYGNYPLYIGRRGGTSIPFTGHIYGLIGIARLTTDSETIALEKSIAKNVGVTL